MNLELQLELERNKRIALEREITLLKAKKEFGRKLSDKSLFKGIEKQLYKSVKPKSYQKKLIQKSVQKKNIWANETPVIYDALYFQINTDGGTGEGTPQSCISSWAFVAADGYESNGIDLNSTCNRAELNAIIKALQYAKKVNQTKVLIRTDSMLCVNCCSGRWKRKANQDLWKLWQTASDELEVRYQWVKGHNGDPGNERANALCTEALLDYKQRLQQSNT